MTKTVTLNYLSIAAPGNSFNNRISADSDIFARNDIDALGNALDLHDHTSGKGLAVGALATTVTLTGATTFSGAAVLFPSGVNSGLTVNSGGLTITAGGATVTAGDLVVTAGNAQITAGRLGLGRSPFTDRLLDIQCAAGVVTGTTQYGIAVANVTGNSTATTEIDGVYSAVTTQATSFTCATVADFHAAGITRGAGSTITSAYGLLVDGINVGGTNNYGVYVTEPSGGSGENANILFGETRCGGKNNASLATNATTGFFFLPNTTGAPTGVPAHLSGNFGGANPMLYDATNNKIWVYNGGWKGVVLA